MAAKSIFFFVCSIVMFSFCIQSSRYEQRIAGRLEDIQRDELLMNHSFGCKLGTIDTLFEILNDGYGQLDYPWVFRFLAGRFDDNLGAEEKARLHHFISDMVANGTIPVKVSQTFETALAFGPCSLTADPPFKIVSLHLKLLWSFVFKAGSFRFKWVDELLYTAALKSILPSEYAFYSQLAGDFADRKLSFSQLVLHPGHPEELLIPFVQWCVDYLGNWNTNVSDRLSLVNWLLDANVVALLSRFNDFGEFGPAVYALDLIRFYWGKPVQKLGVTSNKFPN